MVRIGVVLAILMAVWAAVGGAAEEPADSEGLTAAREAYEQNLALGQSLDGRPATAEQAAEAERLFEAALSGARAEVTDSPRSAEAHDLAGMVLCTGYRAVSAPSSEGTRETVTVLRAGGAQCEEGLAEIRAAVRLARERPRYGLDYARALEACGEPEESRKEALALWAARRSMSGEECAECAGILADIARESGDAEEEVGWLRRGLAYAPGDMETARRLIAVQESMSRIGWVPYGTGKELAAREKKPMVVVVVSRSCGWCRKLEAETLTNRKVVDFCKGCVCSQVMLEEQPRTARSLGVRSYPQTVILDASGQEVGRIVGYAPADQYLAELERALGMEQRDVQP